MEKPTENFCKKFHINQKRIWLSHLRFVKLMIIVCFGEMVFAASSGAQIITMIQSLFTRFDWADAWSTIPYLGMDAWDYITVGVAFVIVVIVDVLKEIGYPIRKVFETKPLVLRWEYFVSCDILYYILWCVWTGI